LSTDTRPGPSPVSPHGEQWFIGAGLAGLVVLAIALRLEPILVEPSAVWPDEIFQASEPAHRLVYGSGLVAWEFQLGVRSWLLPGVIAGLMELSRLAGEGPRYYLPLIAGGFAVLGAAPVVCSFLWCRPLFGALGSLLAAAAIAVSPELVYFGARTLSEVVAGHVLVIALYVLEPGYLVTSYRRLVIGGALLGLVFVTRVQLAPAVAIVALWTNWRADRERLLAMLTGAIAILSASGALDAVTLGYPFASLWRYVVYNLYDGVSSTFGVEPWNYYLLGELGVWGGACATLLLLATVGALRKPLLLAVAGSILLTHSVIAHKEYRFIYPAVLLLAMLGSMGLAQSAGWAQDWLINRGKTRTIAILAGNTFALGWWCLASYQVWTGPTLINHRQRMHDSLAAASFVAQRPAVCGIGLYGLNGEDWGVYGGYTYFHQPVPMYWPKDEAALTAAAGGFDTLLYTQPPPPALGFNTVECIGEVCVAERRGGCRSLPMTPIPVPDALRETGAAQATFSGWGIDGNMALARPVDGIR
jgi:phosphatidylinositol glycan class B